MVAYGGAATVPMAQPLIWRKCLPLKLKLLSVNMCFKRVVTTVVGGLLMVLVSKHSFRADSPSSCLMF